MELQPLPPLQRVVTTGRELKIARTAMFEDGLEGLCTAINPAGDTVAVGCRNSRILVMDLKQLKMEVHDLSNNNISAITSIHYRPDGQSGNQNVALVAQKDHILTMHMTTGNVMDSRLEPLNKIAALALSPHGAALLATAGSDAVVRIYDEATGKLREKLASGDDVTTTGHTNHVYSVCWNQDDPTMLVSGGWDRTIQVWDLRVARSVRSIFGPYICGDSIDIQGNKVVTGSWRHTHPLQLWDLASCRLLTNVPFFQPEHEACMLYTAKFGTDFLSGLLLAAGSGKRPCLKAFRATGEVVGTLPCPAAVHSIALVSKAPKDRTIVLCCEDRIICSEI